MRPWPAPTLFVAEGHEAALVRERIEAVLRGELGWRLVQVRSRSVVESERPLAGRLLSGPRLAVT